MNLQRLCTLPGAWPVRFIRMFQQMVFETDPFNAGEGALRGLDLA